MSKTRASCFIRGSKHLETIKALGLRPRAFICFSVFGTPDETLAKKKYARTNVLKYHFFNRITDLWNHLPLDIHASENVNIFKSRVKNFFSVSEAE